MSESSNSWLWFVAALIVTACLWLIGELVFVYDSSGFPVGIVKFDIVISGIVFFMTVGIGGLLYSIWRITHD